MAAMAAANMSDANIKDILFELKKKDFWDPDPWYSVIYNAFFLFKGWPGYLKGKSFIRLLERIPVKLLEECETPLAISATNLTSKKEEVFTRGELSKVIAASGAVPGLFKPVEYNGSLFVDGGIVNKAPVKPLVDLMDLDVIFVHLISSKNVAQSPNEFLHKPFTPLRIYHLACNISRKEAYEKQCKMIRDSGIEVIEVVTSGTTAGPRHLDKGPLIYERAKQITLDKLSKEGF